MKRLGFIGGGHMAEAIIRGLLPSIPMRDLQLTVCDVSSARCDVLQKIYPLTIAASCGQVLATCDYIFIAVKPQVFPEIEGELAANYRAGTILLSIMAGLSLSTVGQKLPADAKLIRLMPNLAMGVRSGACLLAADAQVTAEETADVTDLLSDIATVWPIEEKMMNGASALTGCGPALVYTLLESLTLGGIAVGLKAGDALDMARETLIGTALLQKDRGEHPAALRDEVLSPGGTTIEGVAVLERGGFRSQVIDFVRAACRRGEELGKGGKE